MPTFVQRDSSGVLKWGCMSYLFIVSVLSTVDDGLHAPSLENQAGVPVRKQSNALLWTGAAKLVLDT